MDATNSPKKSMSMEQLVSDLCTRFPELSFKPGQQFCWSPETNEVFYAIAPWNSSSNWSLLHETGHALLKHVAYQADFELIRLEVAAWDQALLLGTELGIMIDNNHIQDCVDTYRDWLYKRSICPHCATKCLQLKDYSHYRCFNCHAVWRVTPSRFCRSYRRTKKLAPQDIDLTVFH